MSQSDQFDIFQIATAKLKSLGLRYYITGSYAVFLFGEFRITNDIDIVIDLPTDRVSEFVAAFDPAEYYISEEAIRDAVAHQFMFNVLYLKTMTKLDFMISRDRPFDRLCLERAAQVQYEPGCEPWIASAEDIVLNKMLFYKEGASEKHLRDIASIIKLKNRPLDYDYLRQWAARLDVLPIWESILLKSQSKS